MPSFVAGQLPTQTNKYHNMANNHCTLSWWYGDLAGAITFTLNFKKTHCSLDDLLADDRPYHVSPVKAVHAIDAKDPRVDRHRTSPIDNVFPRQERAV